MASESELLFYWQQYKQGQLSLTQIAQRLGMSESEARNRLQGLSGITETKQVLNG